LHAVAVDLAQGLVIVCICDSISAELIFLGTEMSAIVGFASGRMTEEENAICVGVGGKK